MIVIKDKQDMLLKKMYNFYKNPLYVSKMLPIVMGESKISIRVLEYFVTNYAKNKKTYYKLDDEIFIVWNKYQSQLDAYTKQLFDPFCRKHKIPFYYNETQYLVTTVAQLNFFSWAIKTNILDYVSEHFSEIYKDMQQTHKKKELINTDTLTSNDLDMLRTQTETSVSENVIYMNGKIEISFDI